MSITASFFDHVKYPAQEFINRDKDFINNGVLNPTSDFGLTYPGGMNININVAGTAWVNGIRIGYDANPSLTLTFATADVTNPRIDLIEIGTTGIGQQGAGVIKVVKGVPQATPLQPQPDSGFIALYAVNVSAGATSISATDITDLRSGISIAGATNTPLSSSVPGTQTCNTTGSAGTSTNAARADHVHPMEVTPNDIGAVAQSDLIYQTAGGTTNEITLTINQILKNGYPVNFIAVADNSGNSTTINNIPVYKPGTTTPPTIKKDKPYTVIYNSSGNCFFLKASAEGNTIAAHVLAGDTFSNFDDVGIIGTLDLSQLVSGNLKSGVTISNGYTNITGKASVVDTADATASAAQILNGKIAYVNGSKVPGTMPENGELNANLNAGQSFNVPSGHTTGGTITANSLASQTPANADASKIAAGYSAWVNGNLVNGNYNPLKLVPGTSIVLYDAFVSFSTFSTSYVLAKSVTNSNVGGTVTVSFSMSNPNQGNGGAYGRIYVNNIAVGTERYISPGTSITWFTEDISINTGDSIQIYAHEGGGSGGGISIAELKISCGNSYGHFS